jgi:EAL domain-containing protein (putative c-di-GMP-specific phosphodiesterase class I)
MGVEPRDDTPAVPDIDANGVDRAQIRAMLRLTPEERLRLVEEFVESAQEIRDLNAARPVR